MALKSVLFYFFIALIIVSTFISVKYAIRAYLDLVTEREQIEKAIEIDARWLEVV